MIVSPDTRAWGGDSRVVHRRERVSSAADPIAGAETFPRDDITCDPRASGSTWSHLVGFAAIGPAHLGLSAQRAAAPALAVEQAPDRKAPPQRSPTTLRDAPTEW